MQKEFKLNDKGKMPYFPYFFLLLFVDSCFDLIPIQTILRRKMFLLILLLLKMAFDFCSTAEP